MVATVSLDCVGWDWGGAVVPLLAIVALMNEPLNRYYMTRICIENHINFLISSQLVNGSLDAIKKLI